jgi:membrane-associated protease RseP (regulator of RpoE activity)
VSLLPEFFLAARTVRLPDREIIEAVVDPVHAGPSPALAKLLQSWPGPAYWADEADGRRLVLVRPLPRPWRERWSVHALLALATLVTTMMAGAVLAGTWPYLGSLSDWMTWRGLDQLVPGWTYAAPLMAILLAHELGHYLMARRYAIDVSPPFFIPAPMYPFLIGTLGAFIRLRSPPADRRQLFDVALAGPVAGLVVALPVLALGLGLSHPLPAPWPAGMYARFGDYVLVLGDSVATLGLRALLGPAGGAGLALELHPAAFAGWIGLLVTMFNLLPMGQLDGGHIVYAALRRWHRAMAMAVWLGLVVLSYWWPGWALWAVVVFLVSRGRFIHPSVVDVYRPMPASRKWLAALALLLFVLTFAPVPLGVIE